MCLSPKLKYFHQCRRAAAGLGVGDEVSEIWRVSALRRGGGFGSGEASGRGIYKKLLGWGGVRVGRRSRSSIAPQSIPPFKPFNMRFQTTSLVAAASLASTVAAHGYVDKLVIGGTTYTVCPPSLHLIYVQKTNAAGNRDTSPTRTRTTQPPRHASCAPSLATGPFRT